MPHYRNNTRRGLSGTFCLTEEITDSKITTITLNFSHAEEGSDNFQSLSYPLAAPSSRVKQLRRGISQTIRTKPLAESLLLVSTRTPSEQQEILHLQQLLLSFYCFLRVCHSQPRSRQKQTSLNVHFHRGLCYCVLYSVKKTQKIREQSTDWTDESGGAADP